MRTHAIAVAVAVAVSPSTSSAQIAFSHRPIPMLPGDQLAELRDMNAHGDMVGTLFDAAYFPRATIWIDLVPQNLGTLPGYDRTMAYAVNQRREVVGVAMKSGSFDRTAFIWDPVNGMRELPPPPSFANAIAAELNDDGTVVGNAADANGFAHVMRWDRAGNSTDLGIPAGFDSAGAQGINSLGEICCTATNADLSKISAARYDDVHGFRLLTAPGGARTSASCISEDGVVAGSSWEFDELVIWIGTTMTSFGKGKDGQSLEGFDRNEQGWMLGAGSSDEFVEFFDGSRFDYVVDFLPPSLNAYSIYSAWLATNGCIMGIYSDDNFMPVEAFLLEPPTRLEIDGGQIGGAIAFRHVAPTFPGKVVATLVSLTGMAGSFHVGRGTHVRLDFDIATSTLLGFPGIGILTLDGAGRATTAAIDIDNDPALIGLPGYACSVVFQGGKTPPVGSTTVPFILE